MSDVNTMNFEELVSLRKQISAEISKREKKEKKEVLKKIRQISKDHDLHLSVTSGKPASRKSSLPAKFADPSDPSNTWTGRGRRPFWFNKALERGVSESDMRIS